MDDTVNKSVPLVASFSLDSFALQKKLQGNHHNENNNNTNAGSSSSSCEPEEHGLLITLQEDGSCQLMFCQDKNFHDIHPNVYCPAVFSDVHKLGGGGSGVTIFAGTHPTLGDVVMKHGADRDLKELFALATIAEELKIRGAADDEDNDQEEEEEKKEEASTTNNNNENKVDEPEPESEQQPEQQQQERRPSYNFGVPRQESSNYVRERIPEFRFIYISPQHLSFERKTWYSNIKKEGGLYNRPRYSSSSLRQKKCGKKSKRASAPGSLTGQNPFLSDLQAFQESMNAAAAEQNTTTMANDDDSPQQSSSSSFLGRICIYDSHNYKEKKEDKNGKQDNNNNNNGAAAACTLQVEGGSLRFLFDNACSVVGENGETCKHDNNMTSHPSSGVKIKGGGYQALKSIVDNLLPLMKENRWKFTFGQKRIGGSHAHTGNSYLYSKQLKGPLLHNLLDQYMELIRHLENLALPIEKESAKGVLERIRKEVRMFEQEELSNDQISEEADMFVGKALKKNVDPVKGRFIRLRQIGQQFRNDQNYHENHNNSNKSGEGTTTEEEKKQHEEDPLFLLPEEQTPAKHMGTLLRKGTLMADVFENSHVTVVDFNLNSWKVLLHSAVQDRKDASPCAMKRLWTCGLTDGGLHNLFVSQDNLWAFDLGEPQLFSCPGFLTKFLFSFFHALGMQEDETETTWINRFQPCNTGGDCSKLDITPETRELLDHAYDAFEITLDRMIKELFHGDDALRWLLVRYVTLQLCSDASFCLQKWLIKGGGRPRDDNHQKGIEKWLWRALWDFYVAYDIQSAETYCRLQVEHPANRDDYYNGQEKSGTTAASRMSTTWRASSLRDLVQVIHQQQQQEPMEQAQEQKEQELPKNSNRLRNNIDLSTMKGMSVRHLVELNVEDLIGDAILHSNRENAGDSSEESGGEAVEEVKTT